MHKFDIICIFELYINSNISSNDDKLNIPGYNMPRVDHPSGNRSGEVCIYYKVSLPIKMFLQECICFDLKIGSKRCTVVSLYRSPSRSADEFENFLKKLNLTMESLIQKNPFLRVVICNFNARSSKWWTGERQLKKV